MRDYFVGDFASFSGFQAVDSTCKDSTHKFIYNPFFPMKWKDSAKFVDSAKRKDSAKKAPLPNTTIISIGANLKNPLRTFKMLFLKMKRNAKIHILSTSPIFKNPPFGYHNQPFFYNATMLLATKMCLLEFYAFIFYMERIFGRGRIRAFKNAARSLDIDIIFFNDIFLKSHKLNIPHKHWKERISVVIPLLYQVNYKGF